MTRKLLHKTLFTYLLFSVLVIATSAPLFYYITERLYIEETDETLLLHKNEFLTYSLPTIRASNISDWNKYNRNVKIEESRNILKDTLFYTSYYDTLDAEQEPYRELNAPVRIEGRPYTYVARINLIETEDLMQSIAILFLIVMVILLSGLFLITRILSQKLWRSFNDTLLKIEAFEIDKEDIPSFTNTNIEEFKRLNNSIEKLIRKNIIIYNSQREFVENAAHELQTPLAIFQAKLDLLIQSPNVTKEQSEILLSLNESLSRLSRLNKNLLLLSKIDNDSYSNKVTVSLNEIIDRQSDFFTEQSKSKNISIQIQLIDIVEKQTNPVLLEILLSNLFLNAIRHNVVNGNIELLLSHDRMVISNTGQPKPIETAKLFNRFSKSNMSEQGNGLGLAIVKKIADLNKWKIEYSHKDDLHSFTLKF